MPQIRITAKFAKDLKIAKLNEPKADVPLVDDWIVDLTRVKRKKVAMAMHLLTRITFLFPYAEIGGAKNIVKHIEIVWRELLFREGLRPLAEQVAIVFQTPSTFCKTKDRIALGHMNDFKFQVECMTDMGDNVKDATLKLQSIPINHRGRMDYPLDYLHEFSKNAL